MSETVAWGWGAPVTRAGLFRGEGQRLHHANYSLLPCTQQVLKKRTPKVRSKLFFSSKIIFI